MPRLLNLKLFLALNKYSFQRVNGLYFTVEVIQDIVKSDKNLIMNAEQVWILKDSDMTYFKLVLRNDQLLKI
jgi:hypothetical protein